MVNDYYKLIRVDRKNKKPLDISFARIREVDQYEGRLTIKYDKSGKVIYRGDINEIKEKVKVLAKDPTITVTLSD